MTLSRRSALIVLLAGLALLLGFFFRAALQEFVVTPAAFLAWFFARTVESVSQQIYWGVMIGLAVLYAAIRLAGQKSEAPSAPPEDSNVTLDSIARWRSLIPLSNEETGSLGNLQRNLREMLATIFASRHPDSVHWEVDEALQSGRIPLPNEVHAFLFPTPPEAESFLRRILRAPGVWLRQWTGRDTAGYHRSIEQVLAYLESIMEKQHDDGK
jgi:hypothetical protein